MIGNSFILTSDFRDLVVGPILGLNAKTVMDSLTIARTNVYLSKGNGTPAVMMSQVPITNLGGGMYQIHFVVDDIPFTENTRVCVIINMPNCLPYSKHFIAGVPA